MVKTHLKGKQARAALGALDELLARCPADWRVQGGALLGDHRSVQLEILVAPDRLHEIDGEIDLPRSLGGGRLRALVAGIRPRQRLFRIESEGLVGSVAGLAPGSSIFVRRSDGPVGAGVACFVQPDGDDPLLLTCGHAFERGAEEKKTPVVVSGVTVARLSQNLLETDSIDGAVCTLTDEGRRAIDRSTDAPTWSTQVEPPSAGDQSFTFWPSHEGASDSIDVTVDSYPAKRHFYDGGWDVDLSGLIRAPASTQPTDSGSIGMERGRYYCLCTGLIDYSYFTPIATIIDRLSQRLGKGVSIWQPSGASPSSSFSLVPSRVRFAPTTEPKRKPTAPPPKRRTTTKR